MRTLSLIVFVFASVGLFGQTKLKTEPGLEVGVQGGSFWANKYTASFYNGAGDNNIIRYVESNWRIYDQIKEQVTVYDWAVYEFPSNMRYSAAAYLGGQLGYRFDGGNILFTNVNVINLKVTDVVTLELDDPTNQTADPTLYLASVKGEEKRLDIKLGGHWRSGQNEQAKMFFELGGTVNFTQVESHQFIAGGLSYNIKKTGNPMPQQIGWGFGAFGAIGGVIQYTDYMNLQVGVNLDLSSVMINDYFERKLKLHKLIFARIMFG